jgi:ribosomal protein L11 methyltransferase
MHESLEGPPSAVTWLVDLEIEAELVLPGGESVDRDTFLGWLWEIASDDGLLGVSEGSVDAAEAAALGLVASPLVLDVAAAPAGRDWVGRIPRTRATCAFATEAGMRAFVARLAAVRGCRPVAERAETESGAVDWRAAFGPVAVPGFGRVLPAWEPGTAGGAAGDATIFIEPGVGFGTGLHETTQLCLAALAAWRGAGGRMDRVLDFGSGSGILGIAAAVLGATRVDAVEIDTACHAAIRANATRNGVADRIHVAAAQAADAAEYDVVVRRDAAGRPTGMLVLSGLRAAEVEAVVARYGPLLGTPAAVTARGDWHCLRFG